MKQHSIQLPAILLCAFTLACSAATSIITPETRVRLRTPSTDTLEFNGQLVSIADSTGLRFTTPKYPGKGEQWPAFEFKPAVTDWSEYDRLVIDLVNASDGDVRFSIYISDSQKPFRQSLLTTPQPLAAHGFARVEISMTQLSRYADLKDIAIVHFFTQRPVCDVELYVAGQALLRPGEPLPEYSLAYQNALKPLADKVIDDCERQLEASYQEFSAQADEELQNRLEQTLAKLRSRIQGLRAELDTEAFDQERYHIRLLEAEMAALALRRVPSVMALERSAEAAGTATSEMLVGVAPGDVRLFPKDMPFEATGTQSHAVSLARNEYESFQVAVYARQPLKNVAVTVSDLVADDGAFIPSGGVSAQAVGFVQTKWRPDNQPEYVGWYPDPILNDLHSCDVAEDDLQSFWVRIYAPKFQKPGIYHGKLAVTADGQPPMEIALTVKVRSFTLPDCSPLPTAISFTTPPQFRDKPDLWQSRKFEYADFLADYKMDYDNLYRTGEPDWEVLEHLRRQGRLVAFNLGNVFNGGISEEHFDEAMAKTIDRLRVAYEKAKVLGLLDYAYIYGFDEQSEGQFPILERCAKALKEAFPGVITMTTSYDHSFGVDTVVKSIDAWCPLTPRFDLAKVAAARAQGRYIWWYICVSPNPPYANWFVESPAIESRLLQGAMSAKYLPDGFLYYATTIWNKNTGIDQSQGPYTTWNPVSFRTWHGDGSLFYCDQDLHPLPSIRMENYRDGMEDYAYACLLKEAILAAEHAPGRHTDDLENWIDQARIALFVPEELVKDMAEYSRDPALLQAWRDGMAEALDASGFAPRLNPWADPEHPFGVRGMRELRPDFYK
ncbi:MAG: DUF4091 domain-containing protein [Victivallales bacterium]|nr:DUF4091 domain-containing protein [Victivallales bacterium]